VKGAFWVASSAIVLDEVLFAAIVPLLPVYVHRFHLSTSQAGLLVAAYPALLLVSGLPGGLLVERVGERRVLIAGTAGLALLTLAYASASTIWELWGRARGAGSAGGRDADRRDDADRKLGHGRTARPDDRHRLSRAGGRHARRPGLRRIARTGLRRASRIPGIRGLCVPGLRPDGRRALRVAAHAGGDARSALALQLARSGAIRAGAALMLTVGLISGGAITLAPLALHALGLSTQAIGVVFIIGAAAGVGGAPLIGRVADQRGARRIAEVLVVLAAASVALLAVPGPALLAGAAFITVKALMYLVGTLGYTSASEHGTSLGPGFGLGLSAWAAGAIVGPIAAGAIADAASRSVAFKVFAALALPLARLVALPRRAGCAV
jgi:MFS family permease